MEKYIQDRIEYWRERLRIDPNLGIRVKYVTNNDPNITYYASIDRNMMEYGQATMEIYDEVFASKDFERTADQTICHELLHLAFHPLIAFCDSMFTGDAGKLKETERLEEQVLGIIEGALTEYK